MKYGDMADGRTAHTPDEDLRIANRLARFIEGKAKNYQDYAGMVVVRTLHTRRYYYGSGGIGMDGILGHTPVDIFRLDFEAGTLWWHPYKLTDDYVREIRRFCKIHTLRLSLRRCIKKKPVKLVRARDIGTCEVCGGYAGSTQAAVMVHTCGAHCYAVSKSERYIDQLARQREWQLKDRAAHPRKYRAYGVRYRAANRAKFKAWRKKSDMKHREKVKERVRDWAQRNRQRVREKNLAGYYRRKGILAFFAWVDAGCQYRRCRQCGGPIRTARSDAVYCGRLCYNRSPEQRAHRRAHRERANELQRIRRAKKRGLAANA